MLGGGGKVLRVWKAVFVRNTGASQASRQYSLFTCMAKATVIRVVTSLSLSGLPGSQCDHFVKRPVAISSSTTAVNGATTGALQRTRASAVRHHSPGAASYAELSSHQATTGRQVAPPATNFSSIVEPIVPHEDILVIYSYPTHAATFPTWFFSLIRTAVTFV